jgi:hypothetical protein
MEHRRWFSRGQVSTSPLIRQELIEAMGKPGCALCGLAWRKSLRYVETLLETAIMDVDQRDDWRRAGGFCRMHADMALTRSNAAGSLAILYEDVLQHEIVSLSALLNHDKSTWWQRRRQRFKQRVQGWLHAKQQRVACPICRIWQSQERLYEAVLLDDDEHGRVIRAFTQSDGLCLPHMSSLMAYHASHANLPALLGAQQQCLARLHTHLNTFIRKQDYRYAHEPYGEEADAWQRVVACLVGGANDRRAWHTPRRQ